MYVHTSTHTFQNSGRIDTKLFPAMGQNADIVMEYGGGVSTLYFIHFFIILILCYGTFMDFI